MRCQIVILTLLPIIVSCSRRTIEESYDFFAVIPISIDWSKAGLYPDNDPNNDIYSASVWFFPKDGSNNGNPIEKKMNNPSMANVNVPIGTYSVLVFNNTISDYSTIGFRGITSYETFEAYAKETSKSHNSKLLKSYENIFIKDPEILAVWHLDRFVVTPEMVTYTQSKSKSKNTKINSEIAQRCDTMLGPLQQVQPIRIAQTLEIVAHVKRLSSAQNGYGYLSGMAGGVLLCEEKALYPSVCHEFFLENKTYYEGSTTDGTITTDFQTFGIIEDQDNQNVLQLDFLLNDGTYSESFIFNVTHQLVQSKGMPNRSVLRLNIEVGLGHDQLDSIIILPSLQSKSAFEVSVTDWNDLIDIPLSM